MNFIESSKTKTLRFVGNGLIVAASFVMVILFGASIFMQSQYFGDEELVAFLMASISLFVVSPLIILILGVIGLFKKNVAINMVTGVLSILYGLLSCLIFVVFIPFLIIAAIQIIGGVLTVIAAVNLNREKTLYETNVLGYQQPSVSICPQPGIRQPFPTPQPPMSQSNPMRQPNPMPQRPMVNNQPQQPVSQPVVNQPNNNIDHSQGQLSQSNPMRQPNPMPQRPMVNNQPQQPVSQPVVNQPNNNVDNSQEQ